MSENGKPRKFYIKNEQKRLERREKFQQDLNLVQNTEGIYKCGGRIHRN